MDLSRILAANIDGRTQNTRYRQTQFQKLQAVLVAHIAEIQDAIYSESGHTRAEVRAEVVLALQELRTHFSSLSLEKDLEAEYRISHGKDNLTSARGAGIIYIVPSTHTLFFSVISALSAALAAGNCVVLEVSSPKSTTGPVAKCTKATPNNECTARSAAQDSARCFGP
jgi:acyl-CoA reductase-like NAD-dependent aldehyde dehydrogenase